MIADEAFALVFDVNGTMIRITKLEKLSPPPYTVLGFNVPDILSEIKRLKGKGVVFELFESLEQDSYGICTFSNGTKVAWFRDPDGNMLSLTEFDNASMNHNS